LNAIRPSELGVTNWKRGDFAKYRNLMTYSNPGEPLPEPKEVSYQIIGELKDGGRALSWMKVTGYEKDRAIPKDVFRLVTVNDLRITPQNRYYDYVRNYIPVNDTGAEQPVNSVPRLVAVGAEKITTAAGEFDCVHYRTESREKFSLEIWASPIARPVGIVRARSPLETLELLAYGNDTNVLYPKLIEPVLQGISRLERGCTSCHGFNNCHESIFPPK